MATYAKPTRVNELPLSSSSEKCDLWIVDLQERLLQALPNPHQSRTVESIRFLLEAKKQGLFGHVHCFLQNPAKLGPNPLLSQLENIPYSVTEKTHFSCLREEKIASCIKKNTSDGSSSNIILTGLEAHICILLTAEDLLYRGYNVIIPKEAVMSISPTDYEWALQELVAIGCRVSSLETILFAQVGSYTSQHFPWLFQALKAWKKAW